MVYRLLTGKDVIQQPLPDLRYHDEEFRTTSKSTHKLWFLANLSEWNIEREARQYSDSIDWQNEILGYELGKEQLECGDEHSVVGRFNQNLCHISTPSLHRYIQADIRFGDFKCAISDVTFKKVPDIALITKEHELRLVGEAKTPWMHDIEQSQARISTFRNYIGQIANYMHRTKCKYGWLTTYDQTMFFRQEPHPKKKGKRVLCHSPVVKHNTMYREIPLGKSNDLIQYRGRVTLIECFLYLVKKACDGGEAINTMDALAWVGPDSSKVDEEDDGYISMNEKDDESTDEMERSKGDKSKNRTPNRGLMRGDDSELTLEELQSSAEGLSIEGQSHPYAKLEWKPGSIAVSFDDSKSKWYYTAQRRKVYVDLHKDLDEGDFFVMNNIRYRARKQT